MEMLNAQLNQSNVESVTKEQSYQQKDKNLQ